MVIGFRAVDLDNSALQVGGTHDVVFRDELVFIDTTEDVTARNNIAFFEVQGSVLPFTFSSMKMKW